MIKQAPTFRLGLESGIPNLQIGVGAWYPQPKGWGWITPASQQEGCLSFCGGLSFLSC